jgi:signal transduction histidine kinase
VAQTAHRAQEALQATQAALAHAARVTTLGEMSASIAHEVSQPLSSIVINGEPGSRWFDRLVEDSQVPVAVRDSGIGIEPAYMEHLFTRFFSTRDGGRGMGLSICRSIIESHGGRIWASSNDGPGATFQFTRALRPENVA